MSGADARVGVVCLGASAGGLRSLEAILSRVPATFPWPILVSQHLQRDHASLMPEILSRVTPLTVREATDGESPVPGVVYTCPSSAELGLSPEGRLTLRAPVAGRPRRIDHLFSTASFARPGLVIAVVLSGTGSDGAAGALVVKLNGGTVIAESDESAQQPAMPRAAVKAGTVDATRPAAAIAPLLADLAGGGLEETTQETRRDVGEIARTLAAASGTDFPRYRFATLRRRIEKRQVLAGVATLRGYHDLVQRDAAERAALVKSLLLPVTEFFRDPPAWDALAREVLPGLVERARAGETIRVWCAGCASGEEAYTVAIALAEGGAPPGRVEILGTDLDPDSVRRAAAGTYDAARMQNVDAARRARFFRADAGAFRVGDDLRPSVGFRVHDLTRDPTPQGPFDVVVCRNVLIYFDDALQAQVLAALEACIAPRGVLFLGRSTTLPADADAFEPIARTMRIFRSRRTTDAPPAPRDLAPVQSSVAPPPGGAPLRVDAVLVEDSSALVLVVDASWRVALANARAREATPEPIVGRPLLEVFPRWRASPVHDALRAAMATGRSVRVQGVPAPAGFVDLTIEALAEAGERRLFLVAHPTAPRPTPARTEREEQQLLREDLAATNDELQTANEELAAANEELQATNEELASLNEEFLSTNQNLASTNAEMQADAEHAQPAADLLHAIVRSRGDAVIACDASRRVTLVTPRAASLLGLDATAVGTRLDARALGVAPATLDEWLEAAAASRAPVQRRAPGPAGALRVSVESLDGAEGARLGWLLTWAPPDP